MEYYGLTILKTLQGQKFDLHHCESGIVVIETKQNSIIEINGIKEMLSLVSTCNLTGKSRLITVAGAFSELTSDAQKFMRTEEANINGRLAEAVVISSLGQRIIGNFYLTIVSLKRPSKLFNSIPKAIEWLNTTGKKS